MRWLKRLVGKKAIVGFGSVMTKNVEDMVVVDGVPAKVIKRGNVIEVMYEYGE